MGQGAMSASITLITLTVADIARATPFYEALGFVKSKRSSQDDVTFMQAVGVVLALWGRQAQIEDAGAEEIWTGNGGIVVARNLAGDAEVDAAMAQAEAAGARILKPASKAFWGGYNGYFADPDGHVWEIAFNPFWQLDEQGLVKLPE
jgi:uncharacterized protein